MKKYPDGSAALALARETSPPPIPHYLQAVYWWAYVHPRAVHVFEREWLVNLILWGNYRRLCDAVLHDYGNRLEGRSLQVACAYGRLTPRLVECVAPDGMLDVIDILPVQLDNLKRKLPRDGRVRLDCMDASALEYEDAQFERALLFFLLHEQPREVREKTLAEALRVIRPGGTLTIVDYAKPGWFNPMRYIMTPILAWLEPFARDLWREDVTAWLPHDTKAVLIGERRFFGGLYQMLTFRVEDD
ncbi:MAG: methyltransferase [Gallionellales bacterium GWA2_60_18]|nr:MAG: methyltransferase [Gallionellales bacterium GWA2_60_18]